MSAITSYQINYPLNLRAQVKSLRHYTVATKEFTGIKSLVHSLEFSDQGYVTDWKMFRYGVEEPFLHFNGKLDDLGKLIKGVWRKDGEEEYQFSIRHDRRLFQKRSIWRSNRNVIHKTIINESELYHEITKDDDGLLIEEVRIRPDNYYRKTTIEYDEYGNQTAYNYYKERNVIHSFTTYEHTYDTFGNWVWRRKVDETGRETMVEREICYYL